MSPPSKCSTHLHTASMYPTCTIHHNELLATIAHAPSINRVKRLHQAATPSGHTQWPHLISPTSKCSTYLHTVFQTYLTCIPDHIDTCSYLVSSDMCRAYRCCQMHCIHLHLEERRRWAFDEITSINMKISDEILCIHINIAFALFYYTIKAKYVPKITNDDSSFTFQY